MKKIWITYAWKDNESEQIDFVVQELSKLGLDVRIDRNRLIPGQRLWPQLDKAITDPDQCDAWAIYVSENSLQSEACLEELAYALDRSLRQRGEKFPLIGIFPHPVDRSIIPSAIATRLYVNLLEENWAEKIRSGVYSDHPRVSPPSIPPYKIFFHEAVHEGKPHLYIEIRRLVGRWTPFVVLTPKEEQDKLLEVFPGPPGEVPTDTGPFSFITVDTDFGMAGRGLNYPAIDSTTSAYCCFASTPTKIRFGNKKDWYAVTLF